LPLQLRGNFQSAHSPAFQCREQQIGLVCSVSCRAVYRYAPAYNVNVMFDLSSAASAPAPCFDLGDDDAMLIRMPNCVFAKIAGIEQSM